MKKILSIFLMLVIGVSLFAQAPGRTVKTIVVDVAARMPADSEKEYTELMKDLVSTGTKGVEVLGGMFTDVNNASVNFALSGWSKYVTREGNEASRKVFANAIAKEIDKRSNVEVQKHYIRLLEMCGQDEVVPALQRWASDKELQEAAVSCLISIGSERSKEALMAEAEHYDNYLLAHTIGEADIFGYEEQLIALLPTEDAELESTIYYALAMTGGEESVSILKKAAKEADYSFDNSSATASYINLLKRDALTDSEFAYGEAKKLYKASAKVGATHTMIAAIEIMSIAKTEEANELVLKSIANDDIKFRNGVLDMVKAYANADLLMGLSQKLEKLDTPAKLDVIEFLGENGSEANVSYITPYIGDADVALSVCAMANAAKLDGSVELIALLCNRMINAENEKEIDGAALALSYLDYGKGNTKILNKEVATVVENGSAHAQVKALELLSAREANSEVDIVIAKLQYSDAKVSATAYKVLASVVDVKQLKILQQLAISASEENVLSVQNAIIVAFMKLPADKRMPALRSMINSSKGNEALFYAVSTRLGDKSVLNTIAETFTTASAKDKKLSLEALKNWNGEEVLPILISLVNDSNKESISAIWDIYLDKVAWLPMSLENRRLFATNVLTSKVNMTPADKVADIKRAIDIIGNTQSYSGMMTVAPAMNSNDAAVAEAACQAVMKIALGNSAYCGEEVISLLETCLVKLNNPDAGYQKEAIKKHLATLAKDGGYASIFNGKDLTGWKGLVQNPIARQKMSAKTLADNQKIADEHMVKSWSVKDGCLYFNGGGDNICTDKMYGDFEMYVDWRLYKKGTEADAGIYLRGTPQVQMWDISRTNVGAQVGSGGLYNNSKDSKPLKVADNALGEWNVLYIKMVGERVTVLLNGEKVVDNVIMDNYWNRAIPIFSEEQIELQAHGSEVEYRNIYVKELEAIKPLTLCADEQKDGFKLLFDGTSMSEWSGDTKNYVSEDGAIVMYPAGHGGNLYSKEQYGDFVLRFEFWLTPGANNGLGIRTPQNVDSAYDGIELQILDDDADIYANLDEFQYHGSVYGVVSAKRGALKPVGEWNTQEVIADGNRIKVTLNGTVIVDADIAEASKNNRETLDGKVHSGLLNKSGYIGFLGHGSHVKFKNIRVKRL